MKTRIVTDSPSNLLALADVPDACALDSLSAGLIIGFGGEA